MDAWLILTTGWIIVLAALLTLGSVASYLRLLMRRLTPVGARKLFGPTKGGRIRPDRERVGVSISALHGAAMHIFAVGLTGLLVLRRPNHLWGDLSTSLLIVLSAVAIGDQLIPFLLVARHDEPEVILDQWMPIVRLAVFLALPLTFPILISTTIGRLRYTERPSQSNGRKSSGSVSTASCGSRLRSCRNRDRRAVSLSFAGIEVSIAGISKEPDFSRKEKK